MIVYSIQTPDFVQEARNSGFFRPDKSKSILLEEDIPFFDVCYQWMMGQYLERVGPTDGYYPLWVWEKRPDLRHTGHGPKGDHMVLLTLDIPDEKILFSYIHPYCDMLTDVSYTLFCEKEKPFSKKDAISLNQIYQKFDSMFSYEGLCQWAQSHEMELDDELLKRQGIAHGVPFSAVVDERSFIAR